MCKLNNRTSAKQHEDEPVHGQVVHLFSYNNRRCCRRRRYVRLNLTRPSQPFKWKYVINTEFPFCLKMANFNFQLSFRYSLLIALLLICMICRVCLNPMTTTTARPTRRQRWIETRHCDARFPLPLKTLIRNPSHVVFVAVVIVVVVVFAYEVPFYMI